MGSISEVLSGFHIPQAASDTTAGLVNRKDNTVWADPTFLDLGNFAKGNKKLSFNSNLKSNIYSTILLECLPKMFFAPQKYLWFSLKLVL